MKSILVYDKDANGSMFPVNDIRYYDRISGSVDFYAYDKKNQELYACTTYANYVFTLTKLGETGIKKDKDIPRLSGKELTEAVENKNKEIILNVKVHNAKIRQDLADSARVQAQRDSIARALELAKIEKKKDEYRRTKNWRFLPLGRSTLSCNICNECTHYDTDSVWCYAIRNDTIYYSYLLKGDLDENRIGYHFTTFSDELKKDPDIAFHYEVFKDSLQKDTEVCGDAIKLMDAMSIVDYWGQIQKIAPYGFFEYWDNSSEYSCVSLKCRYMNTNRKTIRYIDIYVKALNAVGDVRNTGHFSGTGPVEFMESASWNWDNSNFYVANDVTTLELSKIVITYMDRTKKILTGNSIKINN